MSYWSTGDKINLGQSDIEITCEGANSFSENQVIGIYIPPSIKFFSGKDCVLNFDIDITNDTTGTNTPTKLCLDGSTGANVLFSSVRTYAGNRQQILEETQEYNAWCSVVYDYNSNDSIRSKRALTEGCGEWSAETRGTAGTTKSIQNNYVYNPFMETANLKNTDGSTIESTLGFTKAQVRLPLHMGMFSNSEKAYPNMLTNGAYIELTLAPNRQVFRVMDSTSINRKAGLNPTFHSVDGATLKWANSTPATTFYTNPSNSQISVENSPFQVGETLGLHNINDGRTIIWTADPPTIQKIEAGEDGAPIKYTCQSTQPNTSIDVGTEEWAWFSLANTSEMKSSYVVSNVRLSVRQLDMTPAYVSGIVNKMKQGGTILFDLPSVSTQLHSTLKSDLQGTISIDCNHAKARSIIAMPCDSKPYTLAENINSGDTYLINEDEPSLSADYGVKNYSDRSGISGIGDYLSSYSFIIDGKQVPNRRIDTDKSSSKVGGIDAGHIIELEKSLQQSHGTTPLSFSQYKNNFLIGRALTLDRNTIFNGINKDTRLLVRYEGTAPQKDKLWKIFVSHVKTLSIKGENIHVVN